jgi:hypothetical protein
MINTKITADSQKISFGPCLAACVFSEHSKNAGA